MAALRAQTAVSADARRRARSSFLALLLAAVGLGGASFALMRERQPPVRKDSGGAHMPRANLRDRVEVKEPEPEAPAPELPPLPEARVPYAVTLFAHTPEGNKGLSDRSRKIIIERVNAALENTHDWIQSVDVRVTIDHHMHKATNAATTVFEGDEVVMKDGRRQIAPYMVEVTVHMHEGKAVVLSSSKHAQATLHEALDDMYDFLRRQMRKEKERRIQQIRRTQQQFEQEEMDFLYGEDQLDDDALLKDQSYMSPKDAELEAIYQAVEEARDA